MSEPYVQGRLPRFIVKSPSEYESRNPQFFINWGSSKVVGVCHTRKWNNTTWIVQTNSILLILLQFKGEHYDNITILVRALWKKTIYSDKRGIWLLQSYFYCIDIMILPNLITKNQGDLIRNTFQIPHHLTQY